MGLDNGICLRVKGELDFDFMKENDEMPYFLNFEKNTYFSKEGWSEYEICYWRKWWGFRDEVVNEIAMGDTEGIKELSTKDVEAIKDVLVGYLTNGRNNEDISTNWTFDELVGQIGWDIVKLSWLVDFMRENAGKIVVEFYDSY